MFLVSSFQLFTFYWKCVFGKLNREKPFKEHQTSNKFSPALSTLDCASQQVVFLEIKFWLVFGLEPGIFRGINTIKGIPNEESFSLRQHNTNKIDRLTSNDIRNGLKGAIALLP